MHLILLTRLTYRVVLAFLVVELKVAFRTESGAPIITDRSKLHAWVGLAESGFFLLDLKPDLLLYLGLMLLVDVKVVYKVGSYYLIFKVFCDLVFQLQQVFLDHVLTIPL